MNTANLQLEGLYMALAAMNRLMVEKGLVGHADVEAALSQAIAGIDAGDRSELSKSNRSSVAFPIRLLLLANEAAEKGDRPDFKDYARRIGQQDMPQVE